MFRNMEKLSSQERIRRTIAGEPVDRIPHLAADSLASVHAGTSP